ncbi:uncharacterized protein TNCV_3637621 [Trichonephila clavipes]|nr:uncharacterized protein TNCV_3637621 [Trichonephila clavipes]
MWLWHGKHYNDNSTGSFSNILFTAQISHRVTILLSVYSRQLRDGDQVQGAVENWFHNQPWCFFYQGIHHLLGHLFKPTRSSLSLTSV